MRARPFSCAILLWLSAVGAALAASDDLDFVEALRERGYDDFAAMQLLRMKKSPYLTEAEKAEASLGLADLYEATAGKESTTAKKQEGLQKATDELGLFLASYPEHDLAADTRFKRAKVLLQRGNLLAEVINATGDAKLKGELTTKAEGIYQEARAEAKQAAAGFKEDASTGKVRRRRRGKRSKASAADIARANMLDALLLDPWITFYSGEIYKGNKAKYDKVFVEAQKKFEAFAKEHKGTDRTLNARRGEGQCYFKMKKYKEALLAYRKVIRTRPIPATDAVRQLTYFNQAECYNAQGKYLDASKTVGIMLGKEWPDLLEERVPVALAAALEQGKALIALAKQSHALAARLKKQKKTKDAAKYEKEAERRVTAAVKNARTVAGAGGPWGRSATDLLSVWLKLLKKAPERTAEEAYADAEGLYKRNKLPQAVPVYREAIVRADPRKHKQLLIGSWLKMGACYAKMGREYESGLCFGHVPRTFGARAAQPKVAFISLYFSSQIYEREKTTYAARRYLDALQFFGRNYPQHEEAPKTQFLAAEISRDQGEYGEAAKDYALIPASNGNYEQAAYLAGLCNWLEFLKLYTTKGKPAAMPYAKAAETALKGFLKWADGLPKIQPERVENGIPWVAKAKVDLGEAYVHEAVGKPAEALRLLGNFAKAYPQYPDLFGKQYYVMVRAHAQLGQMPAAEQAFDHMVKRLKGGDESVMAARLIGKGYQGKWEQANKAGQTAQLKPLADKAAKYLAMVVTVKPEQPMTDYLWIGDSLFKMDKFRMASDLFQKARDRFEPEVGKSVTEDQIYAFKQRQAEALLALKDYGAALALVQEAVKRAPKVIDYRRDLAMCYEKSGRTQEALDAWRRVASMSPIGDPYWHLGKAKVMHAHLAANNPDQAYRMLLLTYEQYPNWDEKDAPEAAALYRSALAKLPDPLKKQFEEMVQRAKEQAGEE